MVQKDTMYIVSSSQKTLLKEILSEKLSLLFGNFEVIEVEGFDNQTARSFVSDKIKEEISSDNIKDYFIQVSQGSPFYLEVLAKRFSELSRKRGDTGNSEEALLDAFADLLYRSDGILNQYFTNNINFFLEKKSRRRFIPVLISLAKGNSTVKTIQNDLGKTDKNLGDKLRDLVGMDLVYSSGVFYKVSDKLFEYWLKNVYILKTRSDIDDMDIKYLEFKHSVEKDFKAYCMFKSRSVEDIVADLFESFEGEKIRLSRNDRKVPRFDSVENREVSDNISEVIGRVKNRNWICRIKQDDIADENDVHDLWELKPAKKNSKITRKIFMPLKGIEQNAFLLAKEQNVWIWDIKQLNDILRLFGKFELVL